MKEETLAYIEERSKETNCDLLCFVYLLTF